MRSWVIGVSHLSIAQPVDRAASRKPPSGGSTRSYAEFLPVARDNVRLHTHAGVEFIYTLKGRLNVHINGQEHALESGDSMYFDSGLPHGYRRGGTSTCCAIVVTTA
jgi:mannose-6-phosphate isomerase-like protein (cupin superfamily)